MNYIFGASIAQGNIPLNRKCFSLLFRLTVVEMEYRMILGVDQLGLLNNNIMNLRVRFESQ